VKAREKLRTVVRPKGKENKKNQPLKSKATTTEKGTFSDTTILGESWPRNSPGQRMSAILRVIKEAVDKNIETFRVKSDFNRTRAFRLRLAIVTILSTPSSPRALTTIILGLKSYANFANSEPILSSMALILSASIPVFTA
jgi:hypothetical protein